MKVKLDKLSALKKEIECDALNIQAMEKELSETADNTNIQPPDDTTVHPNPVQLHYIINGRKTGVIHFDAADRIIFVDDLYSDDVMKEVKQKHDKHLMSTSVGRQECWIQHEMKIIEKLDYVFKNNKRCKLSREAKRHKRVSVFMVPAPLMWQFK